MLAEKEFLEVLMIKKRRYKKAVGKVFHHGYIVDE